MIMLAVHAYKIQQFNMFINQQITTFFNYATLLVELGDRGSTVVKVLCYKTEGRWFDPSWRHWIFH